MLDDTEAATFCAWLEAEDAEELATVAHHRVQAARLLEEEESKAIALEQTATTVHQRVPSLSLSSSSPAVAL
jgi:hypothetical protein